MDPQLLYENIGYAASVLVALSLMMRSILRLRILNLIGALFFTIYGLVIQAYPVAGVNFFIVLINVYFLYQIYAAREYFHLLPVNPNDRYLQYFLNIHKSEIEQFEPFAPFTAGQEIRNIHVIYGKWALLYEMHLVRSRSINCSTAASTEERRRPKEEDNHGLV